MNKNLLLMLSIIMFSFSTIAFGQQQIITGKVLDTHNEPLPGVSVVVKGTSKGTVTNIDGKFELPNISNKSILQFKFMGMKDQEQPVNGASYIEITMDEVSIDLNEFVAVGYGVMKKSDLTGSVATVKAEDLTKTAVTNVASALQGRAAGVQVVQNSGAPGSDISVRVRGISSINNQGTLWIVDGVPSDPGSVNSNDIESFEILKDASSASIYGSNGANGVILITTKKGNTGKVKANLSIYSGTQSVPGRIDVADGPQFGKMYNEYLALKYPNGIPLDAQPKNGLNYADLPTYDYQDMIFQNADINNIDLGISGGNEKSSSYLGVGMINQEGILKATAYKKLNVRLNNDYKLTPYLKIGENISLSQTHSNGWSSSEYSNEYASPIMKAIEFHPYIAPYDNTGNWMPRELGTTDSPIPDIDMRKDGKNNFAVNATFYAVLEPFKGLTIETRYNKSIYNGDSFRFYPTYNYGSSPGQFNNISSVDRSSYKGESYLWQNILTYNTKINKDINVGLILGNEMSASESSYMSGTAQYLLTEEPEMWYFDASTDTTRSQFPHGSALQSAGYSYLGRINIEIKNRYLLQGNFRRDYSSKFGPNFRSGNFPGLSAGWKFTEESFAKKHLPFLDFGKLRYAIGRAGNNAVRDYAYFATVGVLTSFKYAFNNNNSLYVGAAPDVLPNRSIHWEDIETQNFGIDLRFLDNRLDLTIERFMRHNIGMLVTTTLPGYAGWTVRDSYQESANVNPNPVENIGKITNKGVEFSLSWKDNIGDLKYDLSFNYTHVRNIATNLGSDSIRYRGSFLGLSNFARTETGQDIGNFWGYKVDRIFNEHDATILSDGSKVILNQPFWINNSGDTIYAQKSALPGDFKYVDVNGDGKINDKDMTIIGNPFPKHILSLNTNFKYKFIDISMFWYATVGNEIFNVAKYTQFNQSGQFNWSNDYINNHYRGTEVAVKNNNGEVIEILPANTNAKYPRLDPLNKNRNFDTVSDFYIEDGSYLRLKNLQLGFTLPETWLKKLYVSELRIYASASNLLTFTKYSGMDPEISQEDPLMSGLDKSSYPQARTYLLGINLHF